MKDEGLRLATQRREAMVELIQRNPEAALAATLPESSRRLLPDEILQEMETPFSLRGDLAVVAAIPRPGLPRPARPLFRQIRTGDEAWEAHVYGRRSQDNTVYDTALSGIRIGKLAAVREDGVRVLDVSEMPSSVVPEPMQSFERHLTAAKDGLQFTADTRIVEAAGRYIPVCCAQHARTVSDTIRSEQTVPPSFVEASGGNANSGTAPTFAPSAHTTGPKSVLVIVADFSDKPGVPVDEESGSAMNSAYLNSRLTSQVSPFLNTVSYANTNLGSVTVTPLLRLSGTLANYAKNDNVNGIKNAALTAAANNGYHQANYDRVMLVFADTFSITGNQWFWAGLADLGGKFIWNNAWFTLGTVSHELLHTYGLRHANLWLPPGGSTDPVDPGGESLEYGDTFDVMGEGPYDTATMPDHPNPWFLSQLGWLPGTSVQSITTSGTYRVYRYDHGSASPANPLSFYVDRDGTRQYWLGYRRKYDGHETHSAASSGAYLVWGYRTNTTSNLIDTTPLDDATNAPLQVGSTFHDAAAGVSFQVTAQGGASPNEYLDVQINFQPRVVVDASSLVVDEKAGPAVLQVHRRGSFTGAISVDYSTQNGTATAADYTSTSGTLSWTNGDTSTKTITVPVTADATAEATETFTIRLSNAIGCVLSHGNITTVHVNDAGAYDKTFSHEEIYGTVYDMAQQPDGRTILVGHFLAYGAMFSDGIVRINDDGTVDQSFEQGEGANKLPVGACARQPDGKILVGGVFTSIRGGNRNHIARLNADGTLDASFDPGTGPNIPGAAIRGIHCITVQPDGKILVGGEFTTWNGVARKCLVRLNADGTLDSAFQNMDNLTDFFDTANGIRSIAIYPTESAPYFSILIGGGFSSASGNPGYHSGVMRLNANGTKDVSFDVPYGAHAAGANSSLRVVSSLAVQPDGKILVGGQFTGFNNVNAGRIARLTSSGGNDSSFITNSGAGLSGGSYIEVSNFVVQPDGRITVAGFFTAASGATGLKGLTRYLSTGSRDTTFVTNHTGSTGVGVARLQPDNQILAGMWDGIDPTDYVRRITSGISGGSAGIIQFASSTGTVTESSTDSLIVQRTGGSKGMVSVNYHSIAGSALEGDDFSTISGTLTWADGDNSTRSITLNAAVDALAEAGESYIVQLSNPLGGTTVGAQGTNTVTIVDAPSNVPVIGFATSTSNAGEGDGAHQVTIQLAGPAATGPVTATLLLGGSATPGSGQDYTVSTEVVIPVPGTSFSLTLNLLDDGLLEGSETVSLSLSAVSGAILNASASMHTITLTDNEVPPGITDPAHQLVNVGGTASFSVTISGSPAPTLQWYKGDTLLNGQINPVLTLNNVQLSDAGAYRCVATSSGGTDTSSDAQLGVVDPASVTRVLALGTTATFSVATAGNGLTYRWQKGVSPLSNSAKYAGTTTKTLSIKALVGGDEDTYACVVTGPGGGTLNGAANTLHLITHVPLITPANPLSKARVGAVYNPDGGADGYQIPFDPDPSRTPTSFSQVGLPSGLKLHPTTGVISGTPTVSKTSAYAVTITASNAKGKHVVTTQILVDPLPANAVGTFIGMIGRHDPLTLLLGGRFDLTTLASGSCSGSVTLAGTKHSFTGKLEATLGSDVVTCSTTVKRTGNTTVNLTFTIDGATGNIGTATLTDSTNPTITTSFTAWRKFASSVGQRGYYTLHLTPPSSPLNLQDIPQGTGYASFTVKADGTLTVSGRLADTTTFSTAGHVSSDNKILVSSALYAKTGSVLGLFTINPGVLPDNTDATLAATTLTWSRLPHTGRVYGSGFSAFPLTVSGARYIPPPAIGPLALNLPNAVNNAKVTFTPFDAEIVPPLPDLITQLKTNGTTLKQASTPNPRSTSLTVTNASGLFTGSFKLVDLNPLSTSTVTRLPLTNFFYGILVTHPVDGNIGLGHFTLGDLPSPLFPSAATTPVFSGQVKVAAP